MSTKLASAAHRAALALAVALLVAAPAAADAAPWSRLDGAASARLASGLSSLVDESNLKRTSDLDAESWWRNDSSWNRYAYVRNNPLKLVDPDGRAIQIATSQTNPQFQQQTLATLQSLTRDTLAMRPNGTEIIRSMNAGGNLSAGTRLIRQLNQKGPGTFMNTISAGSGGNAASPANATAASNGTGSNASVTFDQSSSPSIDVVDSQGNFTTQTNRPNAVGLGHELIHASHINQGGVDFTNSTQTVTDAAGGVLTSTAANEEHRTVGVGGNAQPGDITENQIRAEQSQPARAIY